jgi:hypothetical protein
MKPLVLIGALLGAASAACGATDDRPRTLAYITDTILAPTCAAAQCHSAFKREVGDQFDTVEAARLSIVANNLVSTEDPTGSTLYESITIGALSEIDRSAGRIRMPYDAPMPDADVQLILDWITDGAEGAQCVANDEGRGCNSRTVMMSNASVTVFEVVECTNGNRGNVVQTCPENQFCTFATGNGRCVTIGQ